MKSNWEIISLWLLFGLFGIILGLEAYLPFGDYESIPEDSICLGCCSFECWLKEYKFHILLQCLYPNWTIFFGFLIFTSTNIIIEEKKQEKNK